MKVLLVNDVPKLGWLGDVVDVSSGYARNYLLPQKLAVIPTEGSLKSIAKEKGKRAQERIKERARLEEAAATVNDKEVVIAAKANEQGHLFGSVGAAEIADTLRQLGFEVADEIVQLPDEHHSGIKQVGTTQVSLKYAEDVVAKVNIVIVPKKED